MKENNDFVVITHAKKMDYLSDYVSLPKNYGSKKYYTRADIQEIKKTIFTNLNTLKKLNLLIKYETRK